MAKIFIPPVPLTPFLATCLVGQTVTLGYRDVPIEEKISFIVKDIENGIGVIDEVKILPAQVAKRLCVTAVETTGVYEPETITDHAIADAISFTAQRRKD